MTQNSLSQEKIIHLNIFLTPSPFPISFCIAVSFFPPRIAEGRVSILWSLTGQSYLLADCHQSQQQHRPSMGTPAILVPGSQKQTDQLKGWPELHSKFWANQEIFNKTLMETNTPQICSCVLKIYLCLLKEELQDWAFSIDENNCCLYDDTQQGRTHTSIALDIKYTILLISELWGRCGSISL